MNTTAYRFLRFLGILLLALSAFHTVYAAGQTLPFLDGQVYYVSPTGNDSAPGTQEQPWRTIQKAANTMPAGSTAIVLAGNYPERVRVQRPRLAFQAQGEVTGQGFVIQADYVTVRGFTLTNWGQSYTTGNGIHVANAGNCVIENNRFLYNVWGGVQLAATSHDCVVRNNVFFRNAMFAVEVMGKNHLIENNDVSHSIQRHPCSTSTASWLDSDAFRFHGSGHVFRNNYVHDMPFGKLGYDKTECSLTALADLKNDYVSDSHMDCFQTFGGDYVAASNVLFDGNRCDLPPADQWIGGAAKMFQGTQGTHDLTFVNNLGIVDFIGEFENADNLRFFHNTFIGSGHLHSQGIQLYDTTRAYVHYNVFYNQANGIGHLWPVNSSVDEGNNSVYRTGGAPKRAAAPGDLWNVNPMLDKNYHPLPGSPVCLPNGEYMGAFSCTVNNVPGFYTVQNGQIFDPRGNVFIVKGVTAVYGAFSGGDVNHYGVYDYDDQFHTYNGDLTEIARLGANLIRLMVAIPNSAYYNDNYASYYGTVENYNAEVDAIVQLVKSKGMIAYIIPHHPSYSQQTIDYLSYLGAKYKDDPQVWLGTSNEPDTCSDTACWQNWQAWHIRYIAALRAAGYRNPIVINGPYWSGRLNRIMEFPLGDNNLVYGAHKYANSNTDFWTQSLTDVEQYRTGIADDVPYAVIVDEVGNSGGGKVSLTWSAGFMDYLREWVSGVNSHVENGITYNHSTGGDGVIAFTWRWSDGNTLIDWQGFTLRPWGEIFVNQYMSAFAGNPPATNTPSPTAIPTQPVTPTETMSSTPASTTTTIVMPTTLNVSETASATINLNGVPTEGYKSAEFTCTYDPNLVTVSNIVVSGLFGNDPVAAIVGPQNGSLIVAIAGSQTQMATTSGAVFTFDFKGLQAGQAVIECRTRVSRGDNAYTEIPSIAASLLILDISPTSTPSPLPPPTFTGQILASKPVTVSLYNADNLLVAWTTTNDDGTFSLTAPAGVYTVVAKASGFLSAQGQVVLVEGEISTKPPLHLIAGDIDGNNVVDQYDAMTIAMNYQTTLLEAADLNTDSTIDVGDLEILSFNYRTAGALGW